MQQGDWEEGDGDGEDACTVVEGGAEGGYVDMRGNSVGVVPNLEDVDVLERQMVDER